MATHLADVVNSYTGAISLTKFAGKSKADQQALLRVASAQQRRRFAADVAANKEARAVAASADGPALLADIFPANGAVASLRVSRWAALTRGERLAVLRAASLQQERALRSANPDYDACVRRRQCLHGYWLRKHALGEFWIPWRRAWTDAVYGRLALYTFTVAALVPALVAGLSSIALLPAALLVAPVHSFVEPRWPRCSRALDVVAGLGGVVSRSLDTATTSFVAYTLVADFFASSQADPLLPGILVLPRLAVTLLLPTFIVLQRRWTDSLLPRFARVDRDLGGSRRSTSSSSRPPHRGHNPLVALVYTIVVYLASILCLAGATMLHLITVGYAAILACTTSPTMSSSLTAMRRQASLTAATLLVSVPLAIISFLEVAPYTTWPSLPQLADGEPAAWWITVGLVKIGATLVETLSAAHHVWIPWWITIKEARKEMPANERTKLIQ